MSHLGEYCWETLIYVLRKNTTPVSVSNEGLAKSKSVLLRVKYSAAAPCPHIHEHLLTAPSPPPIASSLSFAVPFPSISVWQSSELRVAQAVGWADIADFLNDADRLKQGEVSRHTLTFSGAPPAPDRTRKATHYWFLVDQRSFICKTCVRPKQKGSSLSICTTPFWPMPLYIQEER